MKKAAAELAVILAAFAAAVAIVHPRGNFPVMDDWDFAIATWRFARTGHFQFTNFTAVSLRAQVLWGALWTRLFGESFEVLRVSTLALSATTLVVVHRIAAQAGLARPLRLLVPLALLVNPIFLWASCTFMTDVPYVFASAVAFYFFLRALREERTGLFVCGCIAVIVSWFIRQNGVVNLAAPAALLLLQRPRRWRAFAAALTACGALFAAVALFAPQWLSGSPAMFARHYQVWTESSFRLPQQIATIDHYVIFNAINSALFFLPLALPLAAVAAQRMSRRDAVLLVIVALLVFARVATLGRAGYLVPYEGPHYYSDILPGAVVFDFGVGPTSLPDMWSGYPYPFRLLHGARIALTVAAGVLASILVWSLATQSRRDPALLLAALAAAFGTLMLCASGYYYDRYSLDSAWPAAVAAALIIPWSSRLARVLAIAGFAALAVFSTLAVQEHFAMNRAKWSAYRDLRARGVPVEKIDGGGEIFAFYELADAPAKKARIGHPPRPYALALRVMPGYRAIARYPFEGFLGMRKGAVLVLSGTYDSAARAPARPRGSASAPGPRAASPRAGRCRSWPARASRSSRPR